MTRGADVDLAVYLGVDALGFIFVKESPRYIAPEEAKEIIASVPPFVDTVGVFSNEDPAIVHEIVQYCGLSVAQLHGSEPPEYSETITCRVVKAFRVGPEMNADYLRSYQGAVEGFLLDTYQKGVAGGTGKTFDWGRIEELEPPGPVILAGGLNPDNVGEAITRVAPFAVDLSSGVEVEPGVKDHTKMREIFRAVREVDDARNS